MIASLWPGMQRSRPHALRYTFATRLLERRDNLREVQELM